ncbi:MAG: ABC transporter ATP-binding protein, partial [Nanoarchaeota archaeon]
TFLRFQEHYESPKFRNKFFSLKEFKQWYTANSPEGKRTGKFTYYSDWAGFNIPSYVMRPFYEGRFDPMSRKEKTLLNAFEKMRKREFYVIGTYGDVELDTLGHEIAHGLFYANSLYRKEVLGVVGGLPKQARKSMADYLSVSGCYHESVFDDETHAYILSNPEMLDAANVDEGIISRANTELKSIFRKYYRG